METTNNFRLHAVRNRSVPPVKKFSYNFDFDLPTICKTIFIYCS